MKFKFPPHFQTRMHERGINIDHVKKAIRESDVTEKVGNGRTRLRKKVNGKTIEVTYYKEAFRDKKNEYVVVTAYYL